MGAIAPRRPIGGTDIVQDTPEARAEREKLVAFNQLMDRFRAMVRPQECRGETGIGSFWLGLIVGKLLS